jgi:spermidine/putrescine transport system permease protein
MDKSYAEAAQDLGASPVQVFLKVTLPLSLPGIASGVMMVFMPTVSTFAVSEILTNNTIMLFGSVIQEQFNNLMWNQGAALSFIMLIIIGITTLIPGGRNDEATEGGAVV